MNADSSLALVLFLLICAALLVGPFYPAWREWQHPTDRQPLRMARGPDSQASLSRLLRQQMTALQASGSPLPQESLAQALALVALPQTNPPPRPLCAPGDLRLQDHSDLHEVLAVGHMMLGPHSRVRGWAHADKSLLVGASSVVAQAITSEHGVALSHDCCFHQIQAPVIVFGRTRQAAQPAHPAHSQPLPVHAPLPGARRWGADGWRVEGHCTILSGRHFKGSLVVTGVLSIGKGAVVEGDLKAHQGIVIGQQAHITGSVFSDKGIRVFDDVVISGPLVAESLLQIGTGVRLGSLNAPTSVSANVILVDDGVTAHGSVQATQAGLVWGPA